MPQPAARPGSDPVRGSPVPAVAARWCRAVHRSVAGHPAGQPPRTGRLAAAWALVVWVAGEGGLASGVSSVLTGYPGAALVYALAAAVLFPAHEPREEAGRRVRFRGHGPAQPDTQAP